MPTMNGVKADGDNGKLNQPWAKDDIRMEWYGSTKQNVVQMVGKRPILKGWDMDCELLETISTLGVW